MKITKNKDSVYVHAFDSRKDQKIEIVYDFYYDVHDTTDTTSYEVDIQSINVVGSPVDIQWLVDADIVSNIIKLIEDREQEGFSDARY